MREKHPLLPRWLSAVGSGNPEGHSICQEKATMTELPEKKAAHRPEPETDY
jgi:hypothetical protein